MGFPDAVGGSGDILPYRTPDADANSDAANGNSDGNAWAGRYARAHAIVNAGSDADAIAVANRYARADAYAGTPSYSHRNGRL